MALCRAVDVMGAIAPLIAGVLSIRAGSGPRRDPEDWQAWLLIGLGCLSWGIGDAIWTYYAIAMGEDTPFPSLADVGYLAGYPLLFAGILFLILPRERRTRLRSGLDALSVVTAAAAVLWHFIFRPIYFESDGASSSACYRAPIR
jgi:hypothetical protein